MAHFHELFLVLSRESNRVVRTNELSRTTIAWVPDTAAAIEVVRGLDRVDLVELYGGFGPTAAAEILEVTGNGELPVGMVGAEYPTRTAKTAAIFEAPGSDPKVDRWTTGGVTVVAVPTPEAAAAAAEVVAEGAERVEVCGGMPAESAAAVQRAVNVPVSRILFGFESLPTVAAYRARFERTLEEHPHLLGTNLWTTREHCG